MDLKLTTPRKQQQQKKQVEKEEVSTSITNQINKYACHLIIDKGIENK